VPRDEPLLSLVPRLVSATYFEEAATAALQAMFACAENALAAGPYASRVRILRGVVHLRPEDSYLRLFGVDRATGAHVEGAGYLTSGNVWSWIEKHRCSVSIDVERASLHSWLPDGPIEQVDLSEASGLPGDATRARMLGRDATHVHVVPLRAPGGRVDGMITLEASGRVAVGRGDVWAGCYEELEHLAGIAGAFISARALPLRPAAPAVLDEFLPVVGQSTAHLVELLRAFAPRDDTILISGPTGAGKSRLARWCHEHSQRQGQPFEALDLLSVPEDLQAAELFGWKRGAFTGAIRDNPGTLSRSTSSRSRRRRASCASSRSGRTGCWGTTPSGSVAPTCACSSAPTPICARPSARAGSARTCTTASTSCRCGCSRSPSGSTRSRAGPTTCWAAATGRPAATARCASSPRP